MPSAVRGAPAQAAPAARSGSNTGFVVWGLLALGLVARLVFIGADGFSNDISSFESWSLTLVDHPISQFYANAGFADYPPGYFFVLWVVGHVYHLLVHDDPGYTWLKIFVKLPAILMDLVDGYLIYCIVRRFASLPWAFGAMALYVFNPATIFISAYWGQVDSVAAGFTLAVLLLAINADRAEGQAVTYYTVAAWLALAYSILIKPPAVMLIPLMLAVPFATGDRALMWRRLRATGWGVLAALVLAFDVAIAFHPTLNPVEAFRWLYERYAFASGVYPYSSVNAFNLYALVHHFWDPDTVLIPNFAIGGRIIGLPQYAWGVLLLLTAVGLVVSRYVQRRQAIALLEGAMILSLGYFVLSTRMHERYSFNAMTLAIPLIFYRRRYLFAAIVLSLTLLGNLVYSLDYLHVMNDKIQGLDAGNLMPWLSRPAALLNVLTFFYLGYVYLGSGADATEWIDFGAVRSRVATTARRWFAPIEGVMSMTPRDWTIASLLSAASFLITYVGYRFPAEKIFDEIYYARAGEEYLTHKDIFEFTHPPLTKLVITFSMMLFGGMHGQGDTAAGWRFMNLVVGAVMVLLLYCFAKRILGSTMFASIAASFLLFDGFHFAQSRIATPEITVAFFSLLTVYTFYRYWLASQVRIAPILDAKVVKTGFGALAAVTAVAIALTYVVAHALTTEVRVIAFLYFELGGYLALRVVVPRFVKAEPVVSYAEGSTVSGGVLTTPDGGRVPKDPKPLVAGQSTRIEKGALHYRDEELRIEYARGGKVTYATPAGDAVFSADGTMQVGEATFDARRDARLWLWLLCISAGCVAASKWNGLFDFFVVWGIVLAVAAQRLWVPVMRAIGRTVVARPAQWGNPAGFSLDIVVGMMLFVGATIYLLTYIPFFSLGHTLGDLVDLQKQMYWYHHNLRATHPYSSVWWQWPILQIPVSYYYHDFRVGPAMQDPSACCVAEIMALPNPVIWWLGLVSVPFVAYLAWRERDKGYTLLVVAYLLQWLPWIATPRLAFEYHFFPNLAIICIADAVLLQRLWMHGERMTATWSWPRVTMIAYLGLALFGFIYWYPVVAGTPITWNAWDARMLPGLEGNNWINPHPGS